jgi:hypothetical protein
MVGKKINFMIQIQNLKNTKTKNTREHNTHNAHNFCEHKWKNVRARVSVQKCIL